MKEMKAKAAKAEAEGIVNGYLEAGKILPKQVEKHIAMAMKAPEDYKGIMDDASVVIDMDKHSKQGQGKAGHATVTDDDGKEVDMVKANKEIDTLLGKGE